VAPQLAETLYAAEANFALTTQVDQIFSFGVDTSANSGVVSCSPRVCPMITDTNGVMLGNRCGLSLLTTADRISANRHLSFVLAVVPAARLGPEEPRSQSEQRSHYIALPPRCRRR
jgi:hypothetical protein